MLSKSFLDSQQIREDIVEQKQLLLQKNGVQVDSETGSASGPVFSMGPNMGPNEKRGPTSGPTFDAGMNIFMDPTGNDDIDMTCINDSTADKAYENELNRCLVGRNLDDIIEGNYDSDAVETNIWNIVEYLGPSKENSKHTGLNGEPITRPGLFSDPDSSFPQPKADGLNNVYVYVLHTNGIHHIGLVTCTCHGQDEIALDLFTCRLLPTSFIQIRTIFTAQLMDYFHLCNLELKASAYQFYQLIWRLTLPMGQSEIVNLYHEFRRMSRLWCWMKKLKWAGYGHNKQDYLNPPAGSLSIFCPTCPQPALNLPKDWKEDRNRSVIENIYFFISNDYFQLDLSLDLYWWPMEISKQIMSNKRKMMMMVI